jgi:hypothetical protein
MYFLKKYFEFFRFFSISSTTSTSPAQTVNKETTEHQWKQKSMVH